MLKKLVTDAKVRELLGGISAMTLWRRRRAVPPKIPFPQPIRINGRNYNCANGFEEYVEALAEESGPTNIIPNAEEGRAKGREKLSNKNAKQNSASSLADADGKDVAPTTTVGMKMRGGDNG